MNRHFLSAVNPSHHTHPFIRTVGFLLLCVVLLLPCAACRRQEESYEISSVTYVSDEEKASWREYLVARLSEMHPGGQYILTDPDAEYPEDRYTYEPGGYSVALLDITLDGVPELIENMGGGSAGNAYYYAYDLFTGETLLQFDGGHDDSWCTYYNTENGRFELYGRYAWRGGWASRSQYMTTIVYNTETKTYNEQSCLQAFYQIELAGFGKESVQETVEELYTSTTFFVRGEPVTLDTYYSEQEKFINTCARLPQTSIKLVSWFDILPDEENQAVRAEAMADALLALDQRFVKP